MLVNLKEILNAAKQGGYAVPAFNVYNMETIMGVIYAAERLHAPVIIQSYSRLFKEDTSYYNKFGQESRAASPAFFPSRA